MLAKHGKFVYTLQVLLAFTGPLNTAGKALPLLTQQHG
jgi:hypothetical protein